MIRSTKLFSPVVFLILASLIVACQPIQPMPTSATTACRDADKVALVQAYVDGLNKYDVTAAVAPFAKEGKITLDSPPMPDPTTGKYFVPTTLEFPGTDAMLWLAQFFADAKGMIQDVGTAKIENDGLTLPARMISPLSPIFGTPATDLEIVYTVKFDGCKIAHLHMDYTDAQLIALEADEQKMNSECSDAYKAQVFQQYTVGISQGDLPLAMLPFAQDALAEYDSAPVFDQATQTYIRGERNQWPGRDALKQVFEYFISVQFTKSLDPSQFKITGSTLEAPVVVSSPSFASDFNLPLTDLESVYTVEFGENCRIVHLQHRITDEALNKLKEARNKSK